MPPKCRNTLKNHYGLCMLEGHGHKLLIIIISIARTKEVHLLMGYSGLSTRSKK
jgi:hypothetical protein